MAKCPRPKPERVGRYSTRVMATKTKAPVRTGKGSRRAPVKVKRGSDVPLLPIAVAGILLAFAIGVII